HPQKNPPPPPPRFRSPVPPPPPNPPPPPPPPPPLPPPPRHNNAPALRPMVAPARRIHLRRAPELAHRQHHRIRQQTAVVQLLQQRAVGHIEHRPHQIAIATNR